MYTQFFHLKHAPFSIAPDPRYLFMSERHREALAHLLYGVDGGGGFVLLTGEIGAGKTTVCRCFMEQLPDNCRLAYIFNPSLSVDELLRSMCDEFGIETAAPGSGVKAHVDAINASLLRSHAQGKNSVLVIDEAQNLSAAVLEQLRLLTNLETSERKLLQIILIGQPELRAMLARPELEQLAQRVIARYHLGSLSESETASYVAHRLAVAGATTQAPFARGLLRLVYRLSKGVPRRINLLCDRALLGAYVENRSQVTRKIVDQAALEVFGAPARWRGAPRRWPYLAAGALAGALCAGVAAWFWLPSAASRQASAAMDGVRPDGAGLAGAQPGRAALPAGQANSRVLAGASQGSAVATGAPHENPAVTDAPHGSAIMAGAPQASASMAGRPQASATAAGTPQGSAIAAGTSQASASMAGAPQGNAIMAGTPQASAIVTGSSQGRTEVVGAPRGAARAPVSSQGNPDVAGPPQGTARVAGVASGNAVAAGAAPGSAVAAGAPQARAAAGGASQRDAVAALAALPTIGSAEALRQLALRWGLALPKGEPCQAALKVNLRCYRSKAGLDELRMLDRPAVLVVRNDVAAPSHVLLIGLSGAGAVLRAGAADHLISPAALATRFDGEFITLRRAPSVWRDEVSGGDRGADVDWLARRLARLYGQKDAPAGQPLSPKTQSLLRRFQTAQKLAPDGMAGPRTFMRLMQLGGEAEPRLLGAMKAATVVARK